MPSPKTIPMTEDPGTGIRLNFDKAGAGQARVHVGRKWQPIPVADAQRIIEERRAVWTSEGYFAKPSDNT